MKVPMKQTRLLREPVVSDWGPELCSCQVLLLKLERIFEKLTAAMSGIKARSEMTFMLTMFWIVVQQLLTVISLVRNEQ